MQSVVDIESRKELEKSLENGYTIPSEIADELEAIGRQLINTVRQVNSNIERLRILRAKIRTEIRNGL